MKYFKIAGFQTLCSLKTREEFWEISFEEKNEFPTGYSKSAYESKGFMESKLIQDFPLRGKGVYLGFAEKLKLQYKIKCDF